MHFMLHLAIIIKILILQEKREANLLAKVKLSLKWHFYLTIFYNRFIT